MVEKLEGSPENELTRFLEYIKQTGPLNYLISLGHNWDRSSNNWTGIDSLSVEDKSLSYIDKNSATLSISSKITALSSYLLLRMGLTENIIFSGGKTSGDLPHKPSEALSMQKYLKNILIDNYAETPDGSQLLTDLNDLERFNQMPIILEETSKDTIGNAIATKDIIGDTDSRVGIMSVGYHMKTRARGVFEDQDFKQVKIDLNSDTLLTDLISYIDSNLGQLEHKYPYFARDYLRVRFEVIQLLQDYQYFMSKIPFTRSHGPEYHLSAKALTEVLKRLRLEKLITYLANKRRS